MRPSNSAGLFSTTHRVWSTLWPGRAIAYRATVTAGFLWLLIHVFLLLSTDGAPTALSPKTWILLVAIAAPIGFVDAKRKRETILLQNIGVSPLSVPLIWSGVMVVLEALLAALVR
jgi:hypothetical protein